MANGLVEQSLHNAILTSLKRETSLLRALILAGGFATRLRPLSCSKPKLLFPLVGVPLIDRLVNWLSGANVTDIVLAVNHLSEKLRTEVASRDFGSKVTLSVENIPLG